MPSFAIIENDLVLITQRKDYAIHFGISCRHLMRDMRLIPADVTPALRQSPACAVLARALKSTESCLRRSAARDTIAPLTN